MSPMATVGMLIITLALAGLLKEIVPRRVAQMARCRAELLEPGGEEVRASRRARARVEDIEHRTEVGESIDKRALHGGALGWQACLLDDVQRHARISRGERREGFGRERGERRLKRVRLLGGQDAAVHHARAPQLRQAPRQLGREVFRRVRAKGCSQPIQRRVIHREKGARDFCPCQRCVRESGELVIVLAIGIALVLDTQEPTYEAGTCISTNPPVRQVRLVGGTGALGALLETAGRATSPGVLRRLHT